MGMIYILPLDGIKRRPSVRTCCVHPFPRPVLAIACYDPGYSSLSLTTHAFSASFETLGKLSIKIEMSIEVFLNLFRKKIH